jgi:hypothetical protein
VSSPIRRYDGSSERKRPAGILPGGFTVTATVAGIALRLDGDDWVPWLPAPEHPHHRAFGTLRINTIGQEYADQKDLLDKLHKKQARDVFVAGYKAFEQKESGAIESCCVWQRGVTAILPRTDKVALAHGRPVRREIYRRHSKRTGISRPTEMPPNRQGTHPPLVQRSQTHYAKGW